MYRCATVKNGSSVMCIADDSGQSGDYLGVGDWQDFTFAEIPAVSAEVLAAADLGNGWTKGCHLVENGAIRTKTVEELA